MHNCNVLFINAGSMFARQREKTLVKGMVKEKSGDPLPGANIAIKETKTASENDVNGNI